MTFLLQARDYDEGKVTRCMFEERSRPTPAGWLSISYFDFLLFLIFLSLFWLSVNFPGRKSFTFIQNRSCRRLTHFELGIHFLDLRDLLFELGGERFYLLLLLPYLLLLLPDRCLQLLNLKVEHRLLGGVGNGLGQDAFGRKSTRIGPVRDDRTQSSIGIDHHESGCGCGNGRTRDIVNKAPVTFLAKHTVHTRVMADDDIIVGGGDTRPGHCAQGNVIARGYAALERLSTDGRVVVSGGIGSESKGTSGRIGVTTVVKLERGSANSGVLCAAGVEQQGCRADRGIGIGVV